MKISKDLLPIKAHYFFFFAALGPLLPQMNVFGRQLGVSPEVMGAVTAVLPVLWALAKPAVGFLVDLFQNQRKIIFMGLILLMSGSYCSLYFLPEPPLRDGQSAVSGKTIGFTANGGSNQSWVNVWPFCDSMSGGNCTDGTLVPATCDWACNDEQNKTRMPKIYVHKQNYLLLENLTDVFVEDLTACDILLMEAYSDSFEAKPSRGNVSLPQRCVSKKTCPLLKCTLAEDSEYYLYGTVTFWGFVILLCLGTVAFNVANCIGDAVCFDVLGAERSMQYGRQRAWGTAGYGLTALAAGWAVDRASAPAGPKDFTPAFALAAAFTLVDMFFCKRLKLPSMSPPSDAGGTLSALLRRPSVLLFLLFAVVAGMFDSFIIYYMFWFLEELATETMQMGTIKLLEGLTVAAQSFGGELIFFAISGKILKRFGFGHTLTFCLLCYALRLFLISFITSPWQILPIELVMQGPTYALCYSTIVGYAAAVAPPGLSATLQGIVAGMDDGFGFAFGSLLGGILYKYLGGRSSFRCFACLALLAAGAHAALVATALESPARRADGARPADKAELGSLVPEQTTGDVAQADPRTVHS